MQVMTRHDFFGSVSGRVCCLALLGDGKGVWVEAAFSFFGKFSCLIYCFDYYTFLELVGYLDIGRMDMLG